MANTGATSPGTMADDATVGTVAWSNPITNNLVAYWKFDESSGDAADATGNSHTGILSGTTHPTYGTGKINNGLIFFGGLNGATSSYLSVPASSDFTLGTGDFTVAFWVSQNNTSGYWCPIDTGYSEANGFLFEYDVAGHKIRIYFGTVLVYTSSTITLTAGTPYYFVARRIGTNLEIFINNVSLGITTNSTNILASTSAIFIGKYSGGEVLDGYLDEFGIWKGHGLTDAEVSALYKGGLGLSYSPFNGVFASDGVYATAVSGSGIWTGHYLKATNFGFTIPTGVTINGILVEVEKSGSSSSNFQDNAVNIVKSNGSIGTTNKAIAEGTYPIGYWPADDTYSSYGSSSDLWGETWGVSDINNSNFGVGVSVKKISAGAAHAANIDHIRVTVYYAPLVRSPFPSFFINPERIYGAP